MTANLGPAYLSAAEAAALIRTTPENVTRMCARPGNLYGQLVDGRWQIHRDEVARYLGGSLGVRLRGGAA